MDCSASALGVAWPGSVEGSGDGVAAGADSTVPLGCGVGSASLTVGVGAGWVGDALAEAFEGDGVAEASALEDVPEPCGEACSPWSEEFPEAHALTPKDSATSAAPVKAVRMRRDVRSYMCID